MTTDRTLLRKTTAQFLDDVSPLARVRALIDDDRGVPGNYMAQGARLGWFSPFIAERYGGGAVTDDPLADIAAILDERGRRLQPGPVIACNVVAWALSSSGTPQQQAELLPGLSSGRVVATWAAADAEARPSCNGVTASPTGDGYRLSGVRDFVPEVQVADIMLVAASLPDGVPGQFLVPVDSPGVSVRPRDTLDVTRRLASVAFDEVPLDGSQRVGLDSFEDMEQQLQVAVSMLLAETVGTMQQLFDMTVQYAKDRVAFGRPIGAFQAIKHLLADLALLVEASRAGVEAVIRFVAGGDSSAAEAVSLVKSFVGDASTTLAQGCLQVHGGIGYTWEHDLHLFYRRLAADRLMFGDPQWHRERVCRLHGLDTQRTGTAHGH